jgi:TPR repeat protein
VDEHSYQRGLEAYERGDYDAALHEWRPLADQGLAEAQYGIGEMYYFGEGVQEDELKAEKWARKAAEQGVARAQYLLVRIIDDEVEADEWLRKAAANGAPEAQYGLGANYWHREEYTEAMYWYRKAAEQGFAEAEYAD